MKIKIIDAGNFIADGGAMFGVVPKILWQKVYPCDENNFCKVALRSLLIDTGDRVFLIDNGCGNKLAEKFYINNHVDLKVNLKTNLEKAGYKTEDITDMVLTHLHFDHCGGSTYMDAQEDVKPTFPNASYYTTPQQWENMMNPNVREGSAMFMQDIVPVQEAGQLVFVDEDMELAPGIGVRIFNGHTPGQLIPWVEIGGRKLFYAADLIPAVPNIRTAWVSAYDGYPITTMSEKVHFLEEIYKYNHLLFFQHDHYTECAEVIKVEKGFKVGKKGNLADFIVLP